MAVTHERVVAPPDPKVYHLLKQGAPRDAPALCGRTVWPYDWLSDLGVEKLPLCMTCKARVVLSPWPNPERG